VVKYAEQTTVPTDKSRADIEKVLRRYGADQFLYGSSNDQALVMFRAHGRQVKFVLSLPSPHDREFTHTPGRSLPRSRQQAEQAWEQACRALWRSLHLVIKAKLEAVEAGITVFEDEFLAHMMLPDGSTVGEWARPQLAAVYERGTMPALMPGGA
jgi:hypothetical protein